MAEPQHSFEPLFDIADEYRPEPPAPPQPPAWMDGSMRIGIHTSIAGDLAQSLDIARKLGCNALQIFSTSPRMWARPSRGRIPDVDAARFRERRAELGLGPLVIHGNYLINLASPEPVLRVRSIQAFHDELVRAVALGADFLVAHPGSTRGASAGQGVAGIAGALRQAARGIKLNGLRILLENTSGMGTAVGASFEELAVILDAVPDLPLGVCLDTAHAFEAGYDIRSAAGLERTLQTIERTVGLERIFIVHVNDSKTPRGSRMDRHEHIGRGRIGLEAFRRILNHPLLAPHGSQGLAGRAFILETPIDRPGDDRRNVRALWKLAGLTARQAPRAEDGFSMVRTAKARGGRRQKSKSRKVQESKRRRQRTRSR
jgi:deoxyribonuclease-4